MTLYRIERLVDGVLNQLWKPVTYPPIEAEYPGDALTLFRRTAHPMRQWRALRAVVAEECKVQLPSEEELARWAKHVTGVVHPYFSCGVEARDRLIFAAREAIRLKEERAQLALFWRQTDTFARGHVDDELCQLLDAIASEES